MRKKKRGAQPMCMGVYKGHQQMGKTISKDPNILRSPQAVYESNKDKGADIYRFTA